MSDGPEVLVVDDETRLADLFAAWLGTEYAVVTAYDGREALDAMSESVDVVLLDRRMAGLSGDAVLKRVRTDGYDARVVMVTATDPAVDAVEMEFDEYLVKPVSKEELLAVVDAVANRSRSGEDVRT